MLYNNSSCKYHLLMLHFVSAFCNYIYFTTVVKMVIPIISMEEVVRVTK